MTDTCKRTLEFSVPVAEVEAETQRVVAELQKKVRIPGFRPGKVPLAIIRTRFQSEVRQDVLESIVPRTFRARAEQDNLKVVGNPSLADVHFHEGQPLKFKAEFEVAPEFELGEYRGIEAPYREPAVSDAEVDARLEALREEKAEYVNIDPRPSVDGDHVVVSLKSIAGQEGAPVENPEMVLHLGAEDTMSEFNENLRGLSPGDTRTFDVSYPENYAHERLAGRKVTFEVVVKGLRRKELPELNDELARDTGDYQNLEELRAQVRRDLLRIREQMNQQEAKDKILDSLVDAHQFPVPETWVEEQVKATLESRIKSLVAQGVDPSKLRLDWNEIKKNYQERAVRDVKASLLLDRIAEREAIEVMNDEVDREVHRAAKQRREPAAAVRRAWEQDGTLRRLALRIRTDKTLNFLFEQARKVDAPAEDTSAGEQTAASEAATPQ